jgi:PST family polysaccharide transporter
MAAAGVIVVQAISILQTIALGRLLGPEQVGIYTAGSVLVSFVTLMAHGTMSQALIQRADEIEEAANTVLVATTVTGVLLAVASAAAAPFIGALFHSETVGLVAAATSGIILMHSLSSVPDALMQRAFQFKRRLIIDPAVAATFAAVAIPLAALGSGAWAMVIASYVSVAVSIVLSWSLAKWRPFRGRFSFRLWREMARFALPLAVEGLAQRTRESLEQVIVGRLLGTASLGQFRYAFRIGSIPAIGIVQVCSYVLFPAFARISGDGSRFRQAFLRALGWLWLLAVPVAALMVLLGEPIVVIMLGHQWQPAGQATGAMAGMGLGWALCSVGAEAIKGAGRSALLTWLAVLHLAIGIPAVLLLLPFGLSSVCIAVSITHLTIGAVAIGLARGVVGVPHRDIWACLTAPTLAGVIGLAVIFPVKHIILPSDQPALLAGIGAVLALTLLYLVVYGICMRTLAAVWYQPLRHAAETGIRSLTGRREKTGEDS